MIIIFGGEKSQFFLSCHQDPVEIVTCYLYSAIVVRAGQDMVEAVAFKVMHPAGLLNWNVVDKAVVLSHDIRSGCLSVCQTFFDKFIFQIMILGIDFLL